MDTEKTEAAKRIAKLRDAINTFRYAYHVEDRSLISDSALDSLKKELFDLEAKFPSLVTPDSPTQRVAGAPLKEFAKVRHADRMTSLNDAFSEEDVRAWAKRLEDYFGHPLAAAARRSAPLFYCELKIDGLAIELEYENGIFVRGSTRGDGLVGEDITQNLHTVHAIPLRLHSSAPRRLVVRGEVFVTKKEFARINKEQAARGAKPYANPRNIAAGSIRQLDPAVTAARRLDSFQYEIMTEVGAATHEEKHLLLQKFGFTTNPHNAPARDLQEVFAFRDHWVSHRDRLDYEIDGTVVILNDNKAFARAGVIGKAPRAAIAYKFSPREATTVVEDIVVQVGRTGALTPVAVMRPVNVGGVTITHASLHNADEIGRLGLKIGDTVVVSRAGDVIPQITSVLTNLRTGKEKKFKMPARCPVDGSPVTRDGAIHRCSSKQCAARHREALYHFVSRGAFNIEGLGPKIIDVFLDEGLVSDAADIFTLNAGDIAALARFGKKSAENIVREAAEKKRVTFPRFLYALGILHVGEETANTLAHQFAPGADAHEHSTLPIKTILKKFAALSREDLQAAPDIGPKVAESIHGWFHEARNATLLARLERAGVEVRAAPRPAKKKKLEGVSFVITGSLVSMSREEAKEKIRAQGGSASESVGKKTSYLVAGAEPGSKYEKARKLGVAIIGEKEFIELLR